MLPGTVGYVVMFSGRAVATIGQCSHNIATTCSSRSASIIQPPFNFDWHLAAFDRDLYHSTCC